MLFRSGRDVAIVWTRDATPEWRKLAWYFPQDYLYVLEERGDPTVESTKARLWRGPAIQSQFTGVAPVRIPLEAGTRIIWVLAGGKEAELAQAVPLKHLKSIFYTDLPESGESLHWGSFEFVAAPRAARAGEAHAVATGDELLADGGLLHEGAARGVHRDDHVAGVVAAADDPAAGR